MARTKVRPGVAKVPARPRPVVAAQVTIRLGRLPRPPAPVALVVGQAGTPRRRRAGKRRLPTTRRLAFPDDAGPDVPRRPTVTNTVPFLPLIGRGRRPPARTAFPVETVVVAA